MVQVIITENGQYIMAEAELASALGIPSTASIVSASWDSNVNQLTIIAVNPVSNEGTP